MADHQKYDAPSGPPPNYPKPVHHDAGPYYGSPNDQQYYGSPPPQGQHGPGPGGYYQPQPGQPMYYGQPPYGQQPQYGPPNGRPVGYYGDRRHGSDGICAGLLAALACCCCLDFLF